MLGFNGGLLGKRRVPTTTAATGLWFPNEQSVARREVIWPTTSDLYFSSVSLLLHMDGSNGSTTFTDNSSNTRTVTANGLAQISTAQSKFGGASGLFDGTNSYLLVPSNSAFLFGASDYTVECWVYPASVSGTKWITGIWSYISPSSQAWALYLAAGTWRFLIDPEDTVVNVSTSAPALNTWTHIACTRSGSVFRMFVNGFKESEVLISNYTMASGSGNLLVGYTGSAPGDTFFNGYIDDLRITKGVARYTANFTPPTAPFPDT